MAEEQLTMFDEVRHPLLEDVKCDSCGGKNLKIIATGCDKERSVEGVYSCNTCGYGSCFILRKFFNGIKNETK